MNGQLSRSGWTTMKFGDVVRQCHETVDREDNQFDRYVEGGHMDSEHIHISRWGEFGSGYVGPAFHRIFRRGQVLYGSRRTYLKKVAVAEFDGITANTTFVLETKDPLVFSQDLLPFLMLTDAFTQHSVKESKGSTNPYITWPDIAKYEFALPPIEEQKRIAELLWAADEAVEAYFQPITSMDRIRSVLLNGISAGAHELHRLGEVLAYASDGPFGSRLKTKHYCGAGAIVVRLQNISPSRYDDSDRAYISLEYYEELKRYSVRSGDVLVAGLGDDTHPVGRACMVPETLGPAINKADCFCLRPDPEVILPEYLCYFLNSGYARREVMRLVQGTTRFRINVSNLQTIGICVPSLVEQHAFINQLRLLDQAERSAEEHIGKTKELQQTMLSALMAEDTAHV